MTGKKLWFPLLFVFLILLVACGKSTPAPSPGPAKAAEPEPPSTAPFPATPPGPTERCPLDGVQVAKGSLPDRPLAIMVENSPEARPQSGLQQADLVFEMLTEGGITRFMAVYLHGSPDLVGPVRSARPYFIDRALELDAMYAHVGGSNQAYADIKKLGVADLDEIPGTPGFWRTKDRKAPHNVYTSVAKLRDSGKKLGYNKKAEVVPFRFGEELLPGNWQKVSEVTVTYPWSADKYTVTYRWNEKTGLFERFMQGQPHTDRETGEQLTAKNLIIQWARTEILPDKDRHLNIHLVEENRAQYFVDGQYLDGFWLKPSRQEKTTYYDGGGPNRQEMIFRPGPVWILVVPENAVVNVK